MRRIFITLLFLVTGVAYAQSPDSRVSAQINIATEAVQSIELITVNTMTIGNTQPGEEIITVNPITDLNAGFMIARGTPLAEFRLDYFTERRLTQIGGPGFLIFRYFLAGSVLEEQSTAELLDSENRTLRFNEDGTYYIWVGGEVNLQNALPGDYEGDFTIEIDYI
jgi:hypothetical protein